MSDQPRSDAGPAADSPSADLSDIPGLTYEDARAELVDIVGRLEAGRAGLEESMTLWERGEALAAHCSTWLDRAEARLRTSDGADDDARGAAVSPAPDEGQ